MATVDAGNVQNDEHTSLKKHEYTLPNDVPEAKRLDLQHEIFRLTFNNKHFFAPVSLGQESSRVLDLGCGTSSWGIEIASDNPAATVVGIDLGQPQPEQKPSNYTYLAGNFEEPWPFDESDHAQQFDFLHGRFILVAMRDQKQFIAQAFKHLKPGGYFEIQEFHLPWMVTTPSFTKWMTNLGEAQRIAGMDMSAALKWSDWLSEAGFVDITHKSFIWPIGVREEDAAKGDEHMCRLGEMVMENVTRGLKGFSKIGYTKALKWTEEDLEIFLEEVRQEIRSNPGKNALPIDVVYGQKPLV